MTAGDERRGGETVVPTVIEQAEQHPAAAREIAAARLGASIVSSLNAALRARGRQAKWLASELGVGESAVSQILGGDGNIRVATLGRYARALGYQARVVLEPVAPDVPRIDATARRRRATVASSAAHHLATLPDSAWHLINTASGDVWAAQTATEHRSPGRVVLSAEFTLLSSSGNDMREAGSSDPVAAGGGV